MVEQLRRLLPEHLPGCYHEPFVGGGALFFALQPRLASLSDVNEELISCYRVVRDEPDQLIAALRVHEYDHFHFYRVRKLDPRRLSPVERAARTIFLNKTAFNGLYRVNSSGEFNVPFGRHRNPLICDETNLRACAGALQDVELAAADFASVLDRAQKNDFVYFDPPYVPVSDTAQFTSYSPKGFSWDEQERLADLFAELSRRGVQVMLSNSAVAEVRKLYSKFRIEQATATRRINSRADGRGRVSEIVVLNY